MNQEKDNLKANIQETLINLNQDRKSKTSPLYPIKGQGGRNPC